MTDIIIHAFFEDSTNLDGETGLSPTIDIRSIAKLDLTNTLVVNNQAMTEIGGGLYAYRYTGGNLLLNDYVAVAKTTSSDVVSKQVPGLRWDGAEQWTTELAYLDALISSRATPADVDLTVGVSATEAAEVVLGRFPVYQSYTFEQALTSDLTDDLSAADKIYCSIKEFDYELDASSIVFITKGATGLTVLNKDEYGTPAHGSLVLSGSVGAWVLTLKIEEQATDLLEYFGSFNIEFKALLGDDTIYISGGKAPISRRYIRDIDKT